MGFEKCQQGEEGQQGKLGLCDRWSVYILIRIGMAEDNIWKKQAHMNRSRGKDRAQSPKSSRQVIQPSSPISHYLKNPVPVSPSPPWAKNNNSGSSSSQPPWAKSSNSPTEGSYGNASIMNNRASRGSNASSKSKESNNQPLWTRQSTVSTNQTSWAKNSVQSSGVPKPAEPSTQPSWVKNSNAGNAGNSGSAAPWAKNSSGTDNLAPWAKNNATTSNQPDAAKLANTNENPPPVFKKTEEKLVETPVEMPQTVKTVQSSPEVVKNIVQSPEAVKTVAPSPGVVKTVVPAPELVKKVVPSPEVIKITPIVEKSVESVAKPAEGSPNRPSWMRQSKKVEEKPVVAEPKTPDVVKLEPVAQPVARPSEMGKRPPQIEVNRPSWVKEPKKAEGKPTASGVESIEVPKLNPLIQTTTRAAESTSNRPSWIKQPQSNTNTPTESGLQSGRMNQTVKPSQPASNKPSWVKQAQSNLIDKEKPKVLPWAKPKEQVKPPGQGQGWAKNVSPEINKNSWKRNQTEEIEKQKQQLEEQIRRQEEEEKEQKKIEKEKRRKEEDQRNVLREISQMNIENQQSVERERFDLEEEARREREYRDEEEQRKQRKQKEDEQRKEEDEEARMMDEELERQREMLEIRQQFELKEKFEEEERQKREAQDSQRRQRESESEMTKKGRPSNRRKRSALQNSKISHISSIRCFEQVNISVEHDPSIPEKLYHKYLRLIKEETLETDYKRKIEVQKSLYQLQLESRRDCESELVSLFASRKVTNRKRKYIFSNSMQIQYSLCEGRNGDAGLEFASEEMDELRTRFLQYEMLIKCVFSLMKKKINLHLRVPLINYAEYKGVSFLVEHVCPELVDIIEIEVGMFQEIANEVLIFEKELELNYEGREDLKPIGKDQLMVKKISIYSEDYYVLYIKGEVRSPRRHKKSTEGNQLSRNISRFGHLNDLNVLEYIIGQNNILPFYQTPLDVTKSVFDQLSKVVPPALKNILHGFCLARALSRVYSSCQGEVDEESFFQLVLEGNKEMWDMISAAGSPDREVPKAITLAYLQKLAPVKFRFGVKMFSRKHKELTKPVKPSVFIQRHDYELFEFIKNLEKYIEEDKDELVEQSLTFSRQLWDSLQQGQDTYEFNFQKLKSQVSYLLYKDREVEAIELIEQASNEVGPFSLETIPIFMLALKIYVAKDMEVPLLKTLSEMLPTLQFYFGEESMIHALVYTAVGSYYSKKAEDEGPRSQKVVTFFEHALNIGLKLYGEKGLEVADIYLGRASAFSNLNQYEHFHRDIQQALKIYKAHSKSSPKIAECNRLMGRVKCLEGNIEEGIELMELSSKQFIKMYNYIESLSILFEMLSFLELRECDLETKIERIVEICFTYKSAWAFKRIVTLVIDRELNCYTSLTIHNLQDLFHPLDADDRTNEEVLIDLEEEIKGFTSFIEIVRWALSIIAGKLASRREATGDYEKAHTIIRQIFLFYGKHQPIIMDSKDLNSQLQ